MTEVDYLGYVHGTRSAPAYRGIPLHSAYCGFKHAIQGFNESLRCELMHDKSNVHVTMVQLPAVNTPQFDWVRSRLLPTQGSANPALTIMALAARAADGLITRSRVPGTDRATTH